MNQYELGKKDALNIIRCPEVVLSVIQTCQDVLDDGKLRYEADEYWRGVYDTLSV